MEYFILLAIFVFVVAVALKLSEKVRPSLNPSLKHSTKYDYVARNSVMTQKESRFFLFLSKVFQAEYFVFPQMHLSTLVETKDVGKRRWSAFLHINRKSVDYVLCDKITLQPICAIELDDWTHSRSSRVKRDIEVERILSEARMPLVRIQDPDKLVLEKLIDCVTKAKETRVAEYSSSNISTSPSQVAYV